MYWYKFKEKEDKRKCVNALRNLGYTESEWSAEDRDAAAIAIYDDGEGCKVYILLRPANLGNNERTSWVLHRKKCETVEEFIENVKQIPFLKLASI